MKNAIFATLVCALHTRRYYTKKTLTLLIVLTLVLQIIPLQIFRPAATYIFSNVNNSANVSRSNRDENSPLMIGDSVANSEKKTENHAHEENSDSSSRNVMCKDEDDGWNPVDPETVNPEHALSVDNLLAEGSKPQNLGFWHEASRLRDGQLFDQEDSVLESAISQPASSSTTLFTEGFEGSFPSTNWWVGDDDSRNAADYWDDTSHRSRSGSWSGWCADIGSKPDGTPNTADWTYDDYMASYLSRRAGAPFDARNWDIAFLTYYVWYDIESGFDELDLSVTGDGTNWGGIFQYDSNSLTSGDWVLTGSSGGDFDYRVGRVPESTSAGSVYTSSFNIGFYFQSDLSVHPEGAYLDDISFYVYDITSPYVSVSKTQASPGETIQLGYKIDNISPFTLKIWLGATLTDQYGNQINDPANDVIVTVTPGYQYYYRDFHIPTSANPGTYDITYALWSGWTSPISSSRQWWSWTWNDILSVGNKDLIIQNIWTQPSSPESGQPTAIWFKVQNTGNLGITETFRNYVYVDDTYYTYRENSGLGAGASYDWSIPDVYLSPGTHQLKVKADATNTVSESDEGNNERTESIYWKGPDLVVLDIWWTPGTPTAGQPFTIYFQIKNEGDSSAYGTFRNKLYIDDNYYAYGDNIDLSAGSTFTWQTPNVKLGYGSHTYRVVTDADNAIQEHNEGNNQRSESCSVVKADWTVLAYLDGDCDPDYMEQFALDAFTGMAQVGSSPDLSIVVQLDRRPGAVEDPVNDWVDTCRFFITPGMSYAHSNSLWSGEVNMGDDNTLIDFVTWAINTRYYEADHYLLVLQNHGGSWVGCCWDRSSGNDRLDLSEIKSALSSIKSTLGKKVDVLFFNDCLMSAIEIATQVYSYADYMAGSESIAYTSTWSTSHYNTLMTTLRNTPSTSPQQLCIQITNIGTLTNSATSMTQSISSIDLSKISSLVSTVDSFALNLKNKLCTYYPQIDNARSSTGWFGGPYSGDEQEIIDLFHFAQNIKSNVPDSTIQSLAQNIMDKIGPAGGEVGYVIMRERNTTSVSYAHGLSIYFPIDSANYDSSYTTDSDFAANTKWDEFLAEYYTPKPDLTITVTAIDPSPPVSEQPVRIWFTLKNIGYGDATQTFVNKFYIDGTYVAYQTQNGLEAGAVILIYYDTTLGPGYHVIRAVADASNNVAECDEANNEDTEKIWWLSPDLVVEAIWCDPANPIESQPFTIYSKIKNQGDADATTTFYTQLYINGLQYGGDVSLDGLAAGETYTWSVWHSGLYWGTHTIEVVTDVYNNIGEANRDTGSGIGTGESNNAKVFSVTPIDDDTSGPSFSNPTHTGDICDNYTSIYRVGVTVTDPSEVYVVNFRYRLDGGSWSPWYPHSGSSGNQYWYDIPQSEWIQQIHDLPSTIQFQVYAEDNDNDHPGDRASRTSDGYTAGTISDDDTSGPTFSNPMSSFIKVPHIFRVQTDVIDPSGIYAVRFRYRFTGRSWSDWHDYTGFEGETYWYDINWDVWSPFAEETMDWQAFAEDYDNDGWVGDRTSSQSPQYSYVLPPRNVVLYVPTDCLTIQTAIDAAYSGDTIYVYIGTYYEHLVIDKAVSLIGENRGTTIIDGSSLGNVIEVTADNVTIMGFTVRNGGQYGIYLNETSNNIISDNNILNNMWDGIYIFSMYLESSNNTISRNNIANNGVGIGLWASEATISENNITNNGVGISATFYSTLGNISENNITENNGDGITLTYASSASNVYGNNISANNGCGIKCFEASCGSVYGNNVSDNSFGFWLDDGGGEIFENTIANNDCGIYATYYFYARVYHNNFISNTLQVDFFGWGETVLWDNGYPSGGNYWSDYNGTDLFTGPYQNETGSDGIGDTLYVIDVYNQDNYPLMKPYGGPHDIGITNITTSKIVVGQGYSLNITIKITNYGITSETFSVSVYANTTEIGTLADITLASRNSTTITFTWNTTSFALGNYTIRAYVTPVPDEIDTSDNTYVDGMVTVEFHDVAVINVVAHPPGVPSGQTVYIDVTVENQGDFSETFEVVVYADRWGGNTHVNIGSEILSLDVGASTILEFTWDTSGVPCGTYWITAEAVLLEDSDPDDNIARTVIGGIFVPRHKPEANILTLMVPIASAILFIVALGMVAIGFFKILMSVRIKWPLRQHYSSRVHKGQTGVVIPYTRGPSLNRA